MRMNAQTITKRATRPGTGKAVRCLALVAILLTAAGSARAEFIRDMVTVQGAPEVPISGIGIVIGLAGTGDKRDAAVNLMRKYLSNSNFDFNAATLSGDNIAIVQVTAIIPPFSRPGQTFPVTVATMGNAKSIEGGQLVNCDLFDGNNELMARAYGRVITGTRQLTRGNIPAGPGSGAFQLSTYPFGKTVSDDMIVRLNLIHQNYDDASNIARRINSTPSLNPNLADVTMFAETIETTPVAIAKDPGQVIVRIPDKHRLNTHNYINEILKVPVSVDRPATILINRSLNSIVITGDVKVSDATVSLQDKTVRLRPETPEQPAGYVLNPPDPRTVVELSGPGSNADLQTLFDTLNAMGLTTEQVIVIFEQLLNAGAIKAKLINE